MTVNDRRGERKLRDILRQLEGLGAVPQAGPVLTDSMPAALRNLREAVVAEIPAFLESGNPEVLPGLDQHMREHVAEIVHLFGGGDLGRFDFVSNHAQRRAEQNFPLEVMLHAYRCGHRILSQWLREAVMSISPAHVEQAVAAVADFAIEYTNIISTIAAADYVARTRLLAEAEGDQRIELMNVLLSGFDESDGRVTRLLKRAGYLEQRQAYCIVVAQPANAAEMEHPDRAQRIITAITDALSRTSIRTLYGVRNAGVTAILSERRRQSGWTAAQTDLAGRVGSLLQLLGPAVLVGISADHPSTSYLPKALQEASLALEFASVATRVRQFAELPVRGLLVHRGGDHVRTTPPAWLKQLIAADAAVSGKLIETLRAIADADMNVQKAARQLGRHPNTLYARLERIHEVTGRDGQRYGDLTELLLGSDCWKS